MGTALPTQICLSICLVVFTPKFIQQFNIVQHQDPLSSLRRAEVTNHCIMVDILAFVVFTAPGSHTPPSDIQAGPLGHTGRPDIQSDLLSDSRASLTVSPQIQPIQPECSDQARSGAG
jgi:hypothetical protein